MKNWIKYTALAIVSIAVLTTSCKKDEEDEKIDNETTTAQDNALSQNVFDDIKKVVEEAVENDTTSKTSFSFGACAIVNVNPAWTDTTTWPKTVTIDFGSTNCTGANGVRRRGKLVVVLSGRYRSPGSVLTVTPANYYVNDYFVEGTKTITNLGRNSSNNLHFSVEVVNAKITSPTGEISTWNSSRTNEWIEGESTIGLLNFCDDVYLISGTANGVSRKGKPYTVNITSPLRKQICCRWVVSGTLVISPTGLQNRIIDFGAGTCDNSATVTIAGNTFTFAMN